MSPRAHASVESIDHLNWSGVPQSMLLLETPEKNRAETFPGSNEFLVVVMVCNQTRPLHLKME
jgi:hypothetical protein